MIRVVSIDVDVAQLDRLIRDSLDKFKAFEEVLKERVVRPKQQQAGAVAQNYYRGMLTAVSDVLGSSGVTSINSRGVKSRTVRLPVRGLNLSFPLTSGRYFSGAWEPLTANYKRRRPRSRTYWRKTGALHRLFLAELTGRIEVSSVAAYTQVPLGPVIQKGPGRYLGRFTLSFPALHAGVDPLIRPAFVRGDIQVIHPKGSPRTDLYVMRYPEYFRPCISRLALASGAFMRQAIGAL